MSAVGVFVRNEIESAFASFDETARATVAERSRLVRARDAAVDRLAGDTRVLRCIDAGSFRHGTEVGGLSWFDVLVVLAVKPTSVPKAIELVKALAGVDDSPFVGGTVVAAGAGLVGAGGAAAAVGAAATTPGVRLIPAFEAPAGASAAGDVVLVADAARHWVASRVGARELLLNRIDDGALRPLIRLVLAWKHRVNAGISSYYLETAVIRHALQQPSFSLLWDLCWSIEQLAIDDLVPLADISSPASKQSVRAVASLSKRIEAGYLVDAAAAQLRRAVSASIDDDWQTVFERVGAVLGPRFPSFDSELDA